MKNVKICIGITGVTRAQKATGQSFFKDMVNITVVVNASPLRITPNTNQTHGKTPWMAST
jgi:hypothetical protein